MELQQAIKTRRSIRQYSAEEITQEQLQTIINAGMLAPSAGNQQPWHYIVVKDRAKLDRIPEFHPYCKMITNAPVAIVVCGDPEGKKWADFWVQDCSAAVQNILLAATDLGIGSVWTGVYPEERRMIGCRALFEIPSQVIPFAIIPLGFPKQVEAFVEKERFNPQLMHQERYGAHG